MSFLNYVMVNAKKAKVFSYTERISLYLIRFICLVII